MQLETINFPSDRDNAFGGLSRELCKALHMASEHADHAALLGEFLKFSTEQLKVAKKDFVARKKIMEARAQAKLEAEQAKERARKEALYGVVTSKIEELTVEQQQLKSELGEGEDGKE